MGKVSAAPTGRLRGLFCVVCVGASSSGTGSFQNIVLIGWSYCLERMSMVLSTVEGSLMNSTMVRGVPDESSGEFLLKALNQKAQLLLSCDFGVRSSKQHLHFFKEHCKTFVGLLDSRLKQQLSSFFAHSSWERFQKFRF